MNWQPPDPPEYGNCLTCNRCVHESEVRGGHCIECEGKAMNNKLRELLRESAELLEAHDSGGGSREGFAAQELRALLAAPVVERQEPGAKQTTWADVQPWYEANEQILRDVFRFEGLRGAALEVWRAAVTPAPVVPPSETASDET